MVELKLKECNLSDNNLLALIKEIQIQHNPHGNVGFSKYYLAIELEKRMRGVVSLAEMSDVGLFEYLSENLPTVLARASSVMTVNDKDKDNFFLFSGSDEGPWYYIKRNGSELKSTI